MKALSILALALAGACGGAHAADNIPEGGWSTSAELGAITTSGNTAGTSVSGKIDARQELANWSNEYIVAGFFKDDEKTAPDGERVRVRSAERIALSAKAAFKLLEDGKKLFVLGSHVDDKFGAYTAYSSMAVGHSTSLYRDKALGNSVDVELGPGYFSGTRATGESESGFTVRGAAALRWQLSPTAVFSQTTSVERGTSNVHSAAEAALSTKINGTMQMKAAFAARNDTNVPEGKKNTDTQTSLTLVYSF
jgi:putative salt-induced outer membrane protein